MASIQLSRDEAEEDDLPDVCMRCGWPATVQKRYRFTSHPLWLYLLLPFGILPYVVAAAILTERARCYTHFCPRHKNHWRNRAFVVWGGLAAVFSILAGSVALVVTLAPANQSAPSPAPGLLCLAFTILPVSWIASIPIVQLTAIHLSKVNDRRLTLVGVSPSFVEAVVAYREQRNAGKERDSRQERFPPPRPRAGPEIYDPKR